jgi:hypothetical protein
MGLRNRVVVPARKIGGGGLACDQAGRRFCSTAGNGGYWPQLTVDRFGMHRPTKALEHVDVLTSTGDAQRSPRLDIPVLLIEARGLKRETGNAHPIAATPPDLAFGSGQDLRTPAILAVVPMNPQHANPAQSGPRPGSQSGDNLPARPRDLNRERLLVLLARPDCGEVVLVEPLV